MNFTQPAADCAQCPRLHQFRQTNRTTHAGYFNAPVPSFGRDDAWLLIVGLAPGLHGANKTGRPFTGDYAGDLLYATLAKKGLASGTYDKHKGDGLTLIGCRVTNAVRCVPPQNKPEGSEIKACNAFLKAELDTLPKLTTLFALGTIAHGAILSAFGLRKSAFRFGHGALHRLPNDLLLADSYHCSRYNTNTGRLTASMFEDVFDAVLDRRVKTAP